MLTWVMTFGTSWYLLSLLRFSALVAGLLATFAVWRLVYEHWKTTRSAAKQLKAQQAMKSLRLAGNLMVAQEAVTDKASALTVIGWLVLAFLLLAFTYHNKPQAQQVQRGDQSNPMPGNNPSRGAGAPHE